MSGAIRPVEAASGSPDGIRPRRRSAVIGCGGRHVCTDPCIHLVGGPDGDRSTAGMRVGYDRSGMDSGPGRRGARGRRDGIRGTRS